MAVVSTAIGLVLGVAIGLVGGVRPQRARRRADAGDGRRSWPFPQIMLALVRASASSGAQTWVIIVAIALTTAPRVARVARGAAQPVVERDFVRGDRVDGAVAACGSSPASCCRTSSSPMMVEASLRLTYSIGVIAALAFLGFVPGPQRRQLGHR
ncbi:MAG: hypothetical protein WKF73_15420 [Nocardioidaceae bacterium]